MQVVPASENDLPAIQSLFREEARIARSQKREPALGPYYPQMMREYIAKADEGCDRHQLLVAKDEAGEVRGFVMALHRTRIYGDFTALHRWAVQSDCQGQGIGKALLQAVHERSHALGKSFVEVHLPEGNPVEIYEKLGFKKYRDQSPSQEGRRSQEIYRFSMNEQTMEHAR